ESPVPDVRIEVTAVDGLVFPTREDQLRPLRRVALKVGGQLVGDRGREGHGARLAGLRPVEDDLAVEELDLLLDVELAAQEVDVVHPQAEHLPLPETTPRGNYRRCPVPVGERVDDRGDPFDWPRGHLPLLCPMDLDRA